jgi:DNA-binding response OmpR family regulator
MTFIDNTRSCSKHRVKLGEACQEQPMKILLVDDDPGLLSVLAYVFRGQGHQASTTCNGFPAVGQWRMVQPDLVVLDVGWPTPLGLDVLRRIQEDGPPPSGATPVVLLTAIDEPAQVAECLRVSGRGLAAADLLLKPFRVRHLVERVQTLGQMRRGRSDGLAGRSATPTKRAGAVPTGWWTSPARSGDPATHSSVTSLVAANDHDTPSLAQEARPVFPRRIVNG